MTDKLDMLSKQSVDFIKRKNLRISFAWQDTWQQEHAHNFTVAKVQQLDILEDMQKALENSETSGLGFEGFKKDLKPQLIKKGWWGKKVRFDPLTGEAKKVQLGSDRRLKTIYRANIRTARAAGQWDRAQRTKKALPYFIYVLGASENHRDHHVAIAGTILPIDHAYWNTHFPPNGWGCKCRVRQITKRDAGRRGYVDGAKAPKITKVDFVNKRTGEVIKVPNDIDAGWATNAGKDRANTLMQHLSGRIDSAGEVAGQNVVAALWADEKYIKTIMALPVKNAVHIPIAVSGRMAKVFKAKQSTVMINSETVNLKQAKQKAESFNLEFKHFGFVQQILDEGKIIYDGRYKNYAVFAEIGGKWFKAVVNKSAGGFMRIKTYHPTNKADVENYETARK